MREFFRIFLVLFTAMFVLYGCSGNSCDTSFGTFSPQPIPPGETFVLEGVVHSEFGALLEGVTVTLNSKAAGSVITGADGYYKFENIAKGNYELAFSKKTPIGYADNSASITVSGNTIQDGVLPVTLFNQTIGGQGSEANYAIELSTGGLAFVGSLTDHDNAHLWIFDDIFSGNRVPRSLKLSQEFWSGAISMIELSDGRLAIVGDTAPGDADPPVAHIWIVDPVTLTVINDSALPGKDAFSVIQLESGSHAGNLVVGSVNRYTDQSFVTHVITTLSMLDPNTLLPVSPPVDMPDGVYPNKMIEMADGRLAIAGYLNTEHPFLPIFYNYAYVWFLDPNGFSIEDSVPLDQGGANFGAANGLIEITKGDYQGCLAIAGMNYIAGEGSAFIWILNPQDTSDLTAWTYDLNTQDIATSIAECADGTWAVTGSTYLEPGDATPDYQGGTNDLWFFIVDPSQLDAGSGKVIFSRLYGGSEEDAGNNIMQASDGSFVISGHTYSTDGDRAGMASGAWILKVNENGDYIVP